MKLYNTLTRRLEDFQPLAPPVVNVYTCGPTVYDYQHIGNWFNYIRMDLLIRALKANGYQPNWVMNITDVGHLVSDADEGEDKLEKGARRDGKSAWDVAEFYTQAFLDGMQQLNITMPTQIVRATQHVAEQIALIQVLEQKGYTYIIDDGVYYDTSKFPTYTTFAKLDLDEQQAGARVEMNPQKRNASDFALWKFSPKDRQRDMEWESPWGRGFPGWHIECSAMSLQYLGPTLDIHTGGIDHIPVHHTNEIAQSEAATGKQFSKYWFHSNHITVNGQKISKSLGNGILLSDITDRSLPIEAVRLHVLESHYRSQSKFSWLSLEAAYNRWLDLRAMAVLRWQPRAATHDMPTFSLEDVPVEVANFLANDLDTPQALAFLSNISTQLQTVHIQANMVDHFETMLKGIDEMLGLSLSSIPDITPEQKQLIAEREQARQNKEWTISDMMRAELLKQGIGIHDAAHGPIWYPL